MRCLRSRRACERPADAYAKFCGKVQGQLGQRHWVLRDLVRRQGWLQAGERSDRDNPFWVSEDLLLISYFGETCVNDMSLLSAIDDGAFFSAHRGK